MEKIVSLTPIPTPNVPGMEAVRVEFEPIAGKFGLATRRLGFLSVIKGHADETIKAIQDGELSIELGSPVSRQQNVYNLTAFDKEGNAVFGNLSTARQSAVAEGTVLEHTA